MFLYATSCLVIPFAFYNLTACDFSVNHKCHFLIRQDHEFGSLCEPYQFQRWLCVPLQLKEQHLL